MAIRRMSQTLLIACLFCAAQLPGLAQHSTVGVASVPTGSQLINVSHCHPALNITQSGGYYGPTYYGGYPAAGWRGAWVDPYGYNYVQPPVTTANPQLAIDYKNITNKTMTHVEFGLVANGRLVAEVHDVGKFSPHAEIKHRFGISANVFPLQTGLPQCVPLRITFDDGTKWRNPKLPARPQGLGGE